MKIKTKILCAVFGMALLVTLIGAIAVNRLNTAAMTSVTREANDVARVVGFLLTPGSNKASEVTREIVRKLHQTQGRNVVLMDAHQVIVADADPSEVGKRFSQDPDDEVGATIKDRQVRTFVEASEERLAGSRQIVVPVEGEFGQIIGAVVLEYTPLYNELIRGTGRTMRALVLTGFGSVAIALLIGLYVGRSVVRPLRQLTDVAAGMAAGRKDLPMPPSRKDEVGELSTAFDNMVRKRQRAEDELRRLRDELEAPIQRLDLPELPRGTETILLVEDDPALREMAATLLRRLGYTVLPGANGIEALKLKQQRGIGHVDLLFTDVVMPHMSGKELSERIRASCPDTRILFTSAYTENAIIHQGVFNKGLALLQKPFTPSALARKLREVLDQTSIPEAESP